MAIRRCPTCGAAVEADESVMSTSCAFCDSPLVDSTHEAEPVDAVAPFVVPKERAVALLKGFLQSQRLAPESVRKAAEPEALEAVFVPFYAYDAMASSEYSAQVGINWQRTETYTAYEDGKAVTKTRTVTETEWFPLSGTHKREWKNHLVSASKGLPEVEANELEPYDLGRAKPYSPALTAGIMAEHPTIAHRQAEDVARNELHGLEKRVIASKILPGDKYQALQTTTHVDVQAVRLVLLPVWIAAVKTPKGPLRLLVNGQTGEVVGKVPRSWTKVILLGLVAMVILALFLGFLLTGGACLSFLGGVL